MNSLLDKGEVARILRVCSKTIERLVAEGKLKPVRVRDRVLFTTEDVQFFIESSKRTAQA